MEYTYKTHGVCSREIHIVCEDGIVREVQFVGGCNGNTKGIGALVKGMPVQEVIDRCEHITCGFKKTSCPDQLAQALRMMQSEA